MQFKQKKTGYGAYIAGAGKAAVFLDRDGVLTEEKGYVARADDMIIFPYVRECIEKIHSLGYLAIVITNQSGVARGLIPIEELYKMNRRLIDETGVDSVYFCPHHFEKGVILKYKVRCRCRKPDIGLIQRACQDFSINMSESWMVGDRAADILLAKNAGIKSVLAESGYGTKRLEMDIRPDFVCADLKEFVDKII